ncbi:transposase IS66 family protein (plasmid) [Rhizobium leguminosarum bv. viciae]|nr:transposase IS66 family protein [Rhizobium leguminosarum bv. viciae]
MNSPAVSYKNHRFPPQIIARAVWLYFRFPLSLRMVEEMLLERGIVVSYETIRRWGRKFGTAYARQLRRKKPSRKDIWHLDEVVISIGGRKHWLWRAVDQDGYVLDEIVQARRDTQAAKRLLVRLLKKQGLTPKRIITFMPCRRKTSRSTSTTRWTSFATTLTCHCEFPPGWIRVRPINEPPQDSGPPEAGVFRLRSGRWAGCASRIHQ